MRLRLIVPIFCVWSAALAARSQAQIEPPVAPQLIRDVRVFDGETVLERRSVLIEKGKISRVGDRNLEAAGAEVIDGRGRTLLPGLIDAHVHIPDDAEQASRQALAFRCYPPTRHVYGCREAQKIKKLELEDRADLADVRTAGIGVTVPGGHPTQMGGPSIPTITSPEQAQSFVDARIAEGSEYIKIIHDDGSTFASTFGTSLLPMVNDATMRAVVEASTSAESWWWFTC